ncbi:flagellar basal body rod protein FlgG [Tumebacillus permanentifrigoris]|uniref:Flagellar hook protein FlgE n=1 Tax=Tumebacillus permanentifrigoris TaxID=378543 RepID=A0A316D7Q6_9BACL|nr:flagellar basal body rod protein FlgG [Tumebacillus permanentifrigoris]PWK12706.1 flagellar hook protein FlgE [Tumebacillus permanentifrigoris]
MLRSLYSGISGMRGFQTKLDTIGNNVANVNTAGFKAGRVMFKDIMSQTLQGAGGPTNGFGGTNALQIGLGSSIAAIDTVMNDGSTQITNRPLDFAIQGNGFFTLVNDAGEKFYTRQGNFYFDNGGNLVNSDGWKVAANDGATPITIDLEAVKSYTFDSKGNLYLVNNDGTTDGTAAATIGLAKFSNPSGLEKVGGSLFRESGNSGTAAFGGPGSTDVGLGTLQVGALEMSNVDLTNEFSEMIVAQRGFQANSRTITVADEILQEVVNLKRG